MNIEQRRAAFEAMKHSIQQARIPGNDWRRELELIENTIDSAIALDRQGRGEPVGELECRLSGEATFWPNEGSVLKLSVGEHLLYTAPVATQASVPASWTLTYPQIKALAAELVEAAETMGSEAHDPEYEGEELVLAVRGPGTVSNDDGSLNERPLLAISLFDYPEEGVHPIDPADCAASEHDVDKVDAERYRLLRRGQRWSVVNGVGDTLRANALDAAIDAARKGQP